MVGEPHEDYLDAPKSRAKSPVPARLSPFASGVTEPTTSVDFASSFPAPPRPFFEEPRPSSSSVYLDLASERQSVRTTHQDLEHELLQSMRSLDLMPKKHAVSNEIPSIFEGCAPETKPLPLHHDKQFFIMSSAGKPIYTMHGQDELVMGLMGIIHTVINYFKLHDTKVHSIVNSSGSSVKQRFVFLDKSPIILMAMSAREESTNDLLQQLDFLYSYLISTLSRKQLTRLFSKRENFDLRRFLTDSDFQNLNHICDSISRGFNPEFLLGALRCLPLRKSTRQIIDNTMLAQIQDPGTNVGRGTLLYGLIVAPGGQLCSVLRPRGHTLHTTDLHLLFSLVFNQFQGLQDDQELWLPICFPKFNSSGFLHCYIRLLPHHASKPRPADARSTVSHSQEPLDSLSQIRNRTDLSPTRLRPALVLISAQKESFFALKKIGQGIIDELDRQGITNQISMASDSGFTMADIPAKFVHHFIYKSKRHVQYVMPHLGPLADLSFPIIDDDSRSTFSVEGNQDNRSEENGPGAASSNDKTRQKLYLQKLMSYYTHIRNNAVSDNGKSFNNSTLTFIKWSNDQPSLEGLPSGEPINVLCLAWLTPTFELLLICNNGVSDRNTALKSAKNIVDWCRKNEHRLFVSNGAIF
ncbi:Vacuolar fusion protein MON1 [Lachancea thermotolerans]